MIPVRFFVDSRGDFFYSFCRKRWFSECVQMIPSMIRVDSCLIPFCYFDSFLILFCLKRRFSECVQMIPAVIIFDSFLILFDYF